MRAQDTNEARIYSKNCADGNEFELYCRSSSSAAKEVEMDALFQQRVGRLQEKYTRVTQYYTIEVNKDPDSNLATKLHFEHTNVKAKEYAGVYCLRTNIMDWEPEKLWRTYIMLTDLEAVFRSLKQN